jgi:hypothetical protein
LVSTAVSPKPVRTRQARQSPFEFNLSPHTEQTPIDPRRVRISISLNLSLAHAAIVALGKRPPRRRQTQRYSIPCLL